MHRLLLKNAPQLNLKHVFLNYNCAQMFCGQQKLAEKNLPTKTSSTQKPWHQQRQIRSQTQQVGVNLSSKIAKSISNTFNHHNIRNFMNESPLSSYTNKPQLKFVQSHQELNNKPLTQNSAIVSNLKPYPSSNPCLLNWLKRIILIAFITKFLESQGCRCDYDINDMMITIELEERLLEQEQHNIQEEGEQGKKKKKPFKPKRSSIKQAGANKEERNGTTEEMLKDQMSSSEEFRSVEERLIAKDIEDKRDQQKQNPSKTQQATGQKTKQNEAKQVKQSLANIVFKHEQKTKPLDNKQPTSMNSHQSHVGTDKQNVHSQKQANAYKESQKYEQNKTSIEGQRIIQSVSDSNHLKKQVKQKSEEPTHDQNSINSSTTLKVDPIKNEINQQPLHQPFIDTESSAIIYLKSKIMQPMSRRIQNFLKLRGVTVKLQESGTAQLQESKETIKIRLCNKLTQCKDIHFQSQNLQNRDVFHHINNFLNPPHVINTVEQAKDLLNLLQNDQSIIGSYIPTKSVQFESHQHKPIFDTFSAKHPPVNPSAAQKQFNEYKYLSSSRKNCFVIVRNEQVAQYLKIPTNKIGTPHILFKYDKQLNGKQSQPNCKIDGEFYHAIGNVDRMIQKEKLDTVEKVAQKINYLTERGFTQTNVIEDMHDKIRQLNQQVNGFSFSKDNRDAKDNNNQRQKKLFVVKTSDPQSEQQINQILQKLSKINKNEVSIIKTQSQALLKSLRIFNNDQYANIRLFDLQHTQQPIVRQQGKSKTAPNNYFERYIPNGPFQIEFLSRWIAHLTPFDKPHTEVDKSINKLDSSYPYDLKLKLNGSAKLVLFYKQGCKGCKLMEDLLGNLTQLQQRLRNNDTSSSTKLKKQICLRYRIQDPEQLSHLQITRFNILNDDPTIQVPQTTPAIYLFNEKNSQKYVIKTQQVFNQLNKIKSGNDEVVHDYMMRELIEEIERNVKRMDNVV